MTKAKTPSAAESGLSLLWRERKCPSVDSPDFSGGSFLKVNSSYSKFSLKCKSISSPATAVTVAVRRSRNKEELSP